MSVHDTKKMLVGVVSAPSHQSARPLHPSSLHQRGKPRLFLSLALLLLFCGLLLLFLQSYLPSPPPALPQWEEGVVRGDRRGERETKLQSHDVPDCDMITLGLDWMSSTQLRSRIQHTLPALQLRYFVLFFGTERSGHTLVS